MQRIINLLNNSEYNEHLNKIKSLEKDRTLCKHDLIHFLDVARIAYVLSLENNYNIEKELIYAAALLHDIGRWKEYMYNTDHALESAHIAEDILVEIGFNKNEIASITEAISEHRDKKKDRSHLSYVLYQSDKSSRLCRKCNTKDSCNRNLCGEKLEILY